MKEVDFTLKKVCVTSFQPSFITTEWTDGKSESNWQPLPLYFNNKNPIGIWIQLKWSVTCRSSVTLWSAPAALKHKTTQRYWGSCALRSAQRQQAWSTAPGLTQLTTMTLHSTVPTRVFLLTLIFVKIVLVCYKTTAVSLYFSTVRAGESQYTTYPCFSALPLNFLHSHEVDERLA